MPCPITVREGHLGSKKYFFFSDHPKKLKRVLQMSFEKFQGIWRRKKMVAQKTVFLYFIMGFGQIHFQKFIKDILVQKNPNY
jgi:hypothetical protein